MATAEYFKQINEPSLQYEGSNISQMALDDTRPSDILLMLYRSMLKRFSVTNLTHQALLKYRRHVDSHQSPAYERHFEALYRVIIKIFSAFVSTGSKKTSLIECIFFISQTLLHNIVFLYFEALLGIKGVTCFDGNRNNQCNVKHDISIYETLI